MQHPQLATDKYPIFICFEPKRSLTISTQTFNNKKMQHQQLQEEDELKFTLDSKN